MKGYKYGWWIHTYENKPRKEDVHIMHIVFENKVVGWWYIFGVTLS